MIQKQLGTLDYELHMDCGERKVVHHNRLKPCNGLKRLPGYYHALVEAKRDGPRVPVESQGQRLTCVSQVRQLYSQREAPLLTEFVCPELTGGSSCCGSWGPQSRWLYSPILENAVVMGVLTLSSFPRMFQCVKCEFSQSRADEVVQHFLKGHLKPSEVPFVCDQCQFRAHTRQAMVDHWRGKHQAPQGEDLDNICYGTLEPIREEEIIKLLPVLHRPGAEGKEKQRSKESSRSRDHGRPSHGEQCSRHRDKSRPREHLPMCSGLVREPFPKRRESPAMPPKGAGEEVVRTYLQKLCDGDAQKVAALAGMNKESVPDDMLQPAEMSLANAIIEGAEQPGPGTATSDNPMPVEEAAVARVAVNTPEKVAPEADPAAEKPQTPVNPPKVPWPVAPYRFPATMWHHRPLSSQLCSISTFDRESLRHARTAGKASTQGHKLAKELVAHPVGCHDSRVVQDAQATAEAAGSTGAATGTAVKGY